MPSNPLSKNLTASAANFGKCEDCDLCAPSGKGLEPRINELELKDIESIIKSHNVCEKNHQLFKDGDVFQYIYVVHSGIFKSTIIDTDGRTRINHIYIPGEVIGLEAIHNNHYNATVSATDTASYCVIPYNPLLNLAKKHPQIQKHLLIMMSKKLNQCQVRLGDMPAKNKIARFIKLLSDRYRQRGFSGDRFHLPLSQRDMANYLGMAEETLSRILGNLSKKNILHHKNHQIVIADTVAFEALAE